MLAFYRSHEAALAPQSEQVWENLSLTTERQSQQLVRKRFLEMAVGTLDRAVLVREAAIIARRRHAVMGA